MSKEEFILKELEILFYCKESFFDRDQKKNNQKYYCKKSLNLNKEIITFYMNLKNC